MPIRFVLALSLAASAAAQEPGGDAKEAALGELMARQFRERHAIVENAEARAYLERIVGELAAAQPGEGECCTVELYDSPEAPGKPTAYPGGYLFVPAKLFYISRDEEAFVLSLAHAVAHIRQRDWNTAPAQPNYANIPLTFMWSENDEASSLPLAVREKFAEREQRADQAAQESALTVRMGGGEFERIREGAPLPKPQPRPSLRN